MMPRQSFPGKRFSSIADLCDIFEKNRQNEPAVSSCTGRARSGLFSQRAEIAAFFACLPLFLKHPRTPGSSCAVCSFRDQSLFLIRAIRKLEGFREKPECIKKDICAKFNHPGIWRSTTFPSGCPIPVPQLDRQTGQRFRKRFLFPFMQKIQTTEI